MTEQSLRERLHATHTQTDSRSGRMLLLLGALAGLVAAALLAKFNGLLWAAPGLIIAGACVWGFLARGSRN